MAGHVRSGQQTLSGNVTLTAKSINLAVSALFCSQGASAVILGANSSGVRAWEECEGHANEVTYKGRRSAVTASTPYNSLAA